MTTRPYAADCFDEIRLRIAQIAKAETPMCPMIATKMLKDCLRGMLPCPETCPFRGDHIGPQPK